MLPLSSPNANTSPPSPIVRPVRNPRLPTCRSEKRAEWKWRTANASPIGRFVPGSSRRLHTHLKPSRSEMKYRNRPSGDQAGSRSSASPPLTAIQAAVGTGRTGPAGTIQICAELVALRSAWNATHLPSCEKRALERITSASGRFASVTVACASESYIRTSSFSSGSYSACRPSLDAPITSPHFSHNFSAAPPADGIDIRSYPDEVKRMRLPSPDSRAVASRVGLESTVRPWPDATSIVRSDQLSDRRLT